MSETNKILILLLFIFTGWLIYKLSPVLTPFFISALLAYLGDPLVDRLEKLKLSRTQAVCIVFVAIFLSMAIALLILIPLLAQQMSSLFEKLPHYFSRIETLVAPILENFGLSKDSFDLQTLQDGLAKFWSEVSVYASSIVAYMSRSGMTLLLWLTNLVLIPVLTFYLLRDWDVIIERIHQLLPRKYAPTIVDMSKECDQMLGGFLRGQLLVMLALAVMYSVGLMVIGVDLAILIGFIGGLLSFVPYLGLIIGMSLAIFAAYIQFQEWLPILYVVIVFSVAQSIESMFLTPRFVGERIGLHPVAVIFAVMAGGALFGFLGVLLALPVAAVAMVVIRYAHQRYLDSELYS